MLNRKKFHFSRYHPRTFTLLLLLLFFISSTEFFSLKPLPLLATAYHFPFLSLNNLSSLPSLSHTASNAS